MASPAAISPVDCDFCRIARGEDNSVEVVCAAENWVAFFPLNPAALGHTLVIPRAHVANLWEVEPNQSVELIDAVIKVGNAIKSGLTPDGMNLITSAGEAAEQTVFHLHMHLVPRWYKDEFGPIWPHKKGYESKELSSVADRIRRACENGP